MKHHSLHVGLSVCPEQHAGLDVLQMFPSDQAREMFLDLWLPVLGLSPDSPESCALSQILHPEYRTAKGIGTTQELVNHLLNGGDGPEIRSLHDKLHFATENSAVIARTIRP